MDYMDPDVLKKADKLNLSLSGLSSTQYEQIPNYTWGLAILADSLSFWSITFWRAYG